MNLNLDSAGTVLKKLILFSNNTKSQKFWQKIVHSESSDVRYSVCLMSNKTFHLLRVFQ